MITRKFLGLFLATSILVTPCQTVIGCVNTDNLFINKYDLCSSKFDWIKIGQVLSNNKLVLFDAYRLIQENLKKIVPNASLHIDYELWSSFHNKIDKNLSNNKQLNIDLLWDKIWLVSLPGVTTLLKNSVIFTNTLNY